MSAATATATTRNGQPRSTPGFGSTLRSEWTKMVSVRSTWITLALAIILSIGFTALSNLAVGVTWSEWTDADQAAYDPVMFSFSGLLFGSIILCVFAVNMVANEYSSGMMSLTLTATPRRGRVMAAKLLLVGVVTLIVGMIIMVGMFFAAQIVLGAFNLETVGLFDENVPRAILGTGALSWFFPVIGAALAFMLRSTAAAITAVLALIWLPEIVGAFLPRWWRENVLSLLPGAAADSITLGHITDSATYLDSTPLAVTVVVAWLMIFIGAAYILFQRRDA